MSSIAFLDFIIYLFILLVAILRSNQNLITYITVVTVTMFFHLFGTLIALNIYFNSCEYQVHGTEIVIKRGILNITENHIPFSNITNIAIKQGPLDQMIGIGTVIIYTGGAKLNNSAREMGQIRGIRIFADVGYFVLNQIKTYETFFTYLLGESFQPKSKLSKDFWIKFLDITKEIKKQLEKN